MNFDEIIMKRCLALGAAGAGFVAPNPMVGAVVVHDGKIIGEGFHKEYGQPHAEVNAINSVVDKDLPAGSSLYVNLEPCNHHGKTPPCTKKIIECGIVKVVIGTTDPNPDVTGGGIQKLKENGIKVVSGILETECRELNKFFFTSIEKKRPFITIKWAQSGDGFISKENRKPVHLTNHEIDVLVHKWRSEHAAILVGGSTIISDDPQLNVRHWSGKNPVRISIDLKNGFPVDSKLFSGESPVIIFHPDDNTEKENIKFIHIDLTDNLVKQIVKHLADLNIQSVLVEGGAKTIQLFTEAGIWDEAKVFLTNSILNNGIQAPPIPGNIISSEEIFGQLLITSHPS